MQRKMEADKPMRQRTLLGAENNPKRAEHGRPTLFALEGEGNPLIRHCPGRRSFGKFNLAIEDHSLIQIKAYRKLLKDISRPRDGGQSAGDDPAGRTAAAAGDPDMDKDVSDREMAAALAPPARGGGGQPAGAAKRARVER
jgi:hypothetical protein